MSPWLQSCPGPLLLWCHTSALPTSCCTIYRSILFSPPPDLSDYNAELHRRVLTAPATCLPPFEEALEEFIRNRSPKV